MARLSADRLWRWALWAATALVLAFLVVPILAVLPLSVNDSRFLTYPLRGFTDRWYIEFFSDPRWTRALANSAVLAVSSAAIATVLGTLAALGLALAEFRGKAVLLALLLSPLVVPVIVFGVGLALFFGQVGLVRTFPGLLAAHVALGAPFALLTVGAALASFDRTLLRAAQGLGASPAVAFRRVVLPLIAPGVLAGFLFAFATSFDEVVVNIFIAAPEHRTLPREMFSSLRENVSPVIAAAATLMTLVAAVLLGTMEWLKRRTRRMTVSA
ncbi:ABC transporter permease [Rubellimicrobium sp. CFH 75288]|uniref:ABC transporter permease n=1 Tax=Rubellimicrobium sp. CFH 75288 TaxID=2697034 RepID=UPI001FB6AAB3|nr:ABC transporter permease [Rubellimicrobium sp. CFH 75288]